MSARRRLLLFDDARARAWSPFAATRPAGELLFGTMTLRERSERMSGLDCAGHLTAEHLAGFHEPGSAPVVPGDAGRETLLLSSRLVLEAPLDAGPIEAPTSVVVDGEVVGCVLPGRHGLPTDDWLERPDGAGFDRSLEAKGFLLGWPWDLVAENAARITADAADLAATDPPEGTTVLGPHGVRVDPTASVEPGVVLDARMGPILLAADVEVRGPARLTGPLHVGRGTVVFGGSLAASTVGPTCKVRGEIESSVLLGFSNKAHDGYLGHALLGRWVNLGAGTTNSDLKNNYAPVRVELESGIVDTGRIKVGCFLGDHVKTGIGTLLDTGTLIGAGSNVFGGRMPPKRVEPFSWGAGDELVPYRLDRFLESARRVMARRDTELSRDQERLLERVWRATHGPAGDGSDAS